MTHHRLEPDGKGGLRPAPSAQARRAAHRAADQRDDHRRHVRPLGAVVPRSADPHQPVGERRALGAADAAVPADDRVPVAGRTHGARHRRGGAARKRMRMLDVYADFAEHTMAMPVIKGEKTAGERFPGAVSTYTIEAMMQDRKALQAGTSHFLGQNFAKAQEIKFQSEAGELEYAWTTSWGVTTRLVGALVMTHCRRRRPRAAAEAGAGARRHHADLSQRRRERPKCCSTARRWSRSWRRKRTPASRSACGSTTATSAAATRSGNG